MIRFFRVFIPVSTFTLLVAEVLFTISCFLAASYLVLDVDPTDYLLYDGGLLGILVAASIFLLGLYFNGLYTGVSLKSKFILLYQLFLVTGLTFLAEGLIGSVAFELRLPIRMMLAGSALTVAVIFSWRLFFSRYAHQILGEARVLLVGTAPVVAAVGRYIALHPQSGLQIAGCVGDDASPEELFPGVKNFGDVAALPEIIHAMQPNRVVVGTRHQATAQFARVLEDLRYAGQSIEEAAETYEKITGRLWVRGIQPAELIYTSRLGGPNRHLALQRFTSPVLALLALVVSLPVMAFTWLVLRLNSSGPVLQRYRRVGMDGSLFTQYCFRSPKDLQKGAKLSGAMLAIDKFFLDGLPQLFNVLKGEMAFVGPRPERPEFVEALSEWIPYYPQRHCVRPGMTGWAQIQNAPLVPETLATLEYDLYYIKYMSMSLNTFIVFQALRSIFVEVDHE